MTCDCGVCQRIAQTRQGQNPFLVREMETGYVVLGDFQRFTGYTLFLCKTHATELHHLPQRTRELFLHEMALTAEAVDRAFHPDKLNYELLGVGRNRHMHWHIFPRREGDTPQPGPVWRLPAAELNDPRCRPSMPQLEDMKRRLNRALDEILSEQATERTE